MGTVTQPGTLYHVDTCSLFVTCGAVDQALYGYDVSRCSESLQLDVTDGELERRPVLFGPDDDRSIACRP